MPLIIHTLKQQEAEMPEEKYFYPGRRLWLTADKKQVVEEGDPKAAFLWCPTPETRVHMADAIRFGLIKEEKKAMSEEKAVSQEKSQDKSVPKSQSQDKSRAKSKGK